MAKLIYYTFPSWRHFRTK